jgi:GrpB-like predicted nucleotidyltransferase (UPF0157 family)
MKIILVKYSSDWPKMFEWESRLFLQTLGDSVAKIEHIGSTSVPGLLSKPTIDIMIGLHDFSVADSLIPKIVSLGYTYFPEFEDVMPNRRFFRKLIDGDATHHIHMTEIDSKFWQRHLLFRDYLREHDETAEKYAELKKRLAKRHWKISNDYAKAKNEFIRNIEAIASGKF